MFFSDIMIQSFLLLVNFGDICQFLFTDMGYFSKYFKRYVIPEKNSIPKPRLSCPCTCNLLIGGNKEIIIILLLYNY